MTITKRCSDTGFLRTLFFATIILVVAAEAREAHPLLDGVILHGKFMNMRVGDGFAKDMARAMFPSIRLEASNSLGQGGMEGVVYHWPRGTVQVWRLDNYAAVVVSQGEIRLVSITLGSNESGNSRDLTTFDDLVKAAATEGDVTEYLVKNNVQFRISERNDVQNEWGGKTQASYRNYVIDKTGRILKFVNGRLLAVLLCDQENFNRLAGNPERLDVLLESGRVWVEPDLMALRLIHDPRPDCPPGAEDDCYRTTVNLLGIGANGDVGPTAVTQYHSSLTERFLKTIQQWRFRPYLIDGSPVEVETAIEVRLLEKK